MARSTYEGMKLAKEDKRPFVLTRAGFIGSQRYAATWTGDNLSTWEHLHMSVTMVLQLVCDLKRFFLFVYNFTWMHCNISSKKICGNISTPLVHQMFILNSVIHAKAHLLFIVEEGASMLWQWLDKWHHWNQILESNGDWQELNRLWPPYRLGVGVLPTWISWSQYSPWIFWVGQDPANQESST